MAARVEHYSLTANLPAQHTSRVYPALLAALAHSLTLGSSALSLHVSHCPPSRRIRLRLPVMRSLVLLCAALLAAVLSFPATSALTVHLVPHTHDDVGWQVTVDQYYILEVQYIITTVIEQLLVNPERKFIYVEQAYFQRWWREQNDEVKGQVRMLVANKQLEFINGGWSQHHRTRTHVRLRTR